MILDKGDLTPEQKKEVQRIVDLSRATLPEGKVYKYEVLAKEAERKQLRMDKHKKEK